MMSDQHVLTNNVIFAASQNAAQNIAQNIEKNTEKNVKKNVKKNVMKNDANNSRVFIDLFDMSVTLNESDESNS